MGSKDYKPPIKRMASSWGKPYLQRAFCQNFRQNNTWGKILSKKKKFLEVEYLSQRKGIDDNSKIHWGKIATIKRRQWSWTNLRLIFTHTWAGLKKASGNRWSSGDCALVSVFLLEEVQYPCENLNMVREAEKFHQLRKVNVGCYGNQVNCTLKC